MKYGDLKSSISGLEKESVCDIAELHDELNRYEAELKELKVKLRSYEAYIAEEAKKKNKKIPGFDIIERDAYIIKDRKKFDARVEKLNIESVVYRRILHTYNSVVFTDAMTKYDFKGIVVKVKEFKLRRTK